MEHSLQIYAILVVFVLVIIRNFQEVNSTITVSSKDELELKLKELYGNDGPLPDFIFYSKNDLLNYTKVKGKPFNRTEKRRKKNPKPKNRTDSERIYGRALNELNRDRYVEQLKLASYFVKIAMSGEPDSSLKLEKIKGWAKRRFEQRNVRTYLRRYRVNRRYLVNRREKRNLDSAAERYFNHLFSDVITELNEDDNDDDIRDNVQDYKETNRNYHAHLSEKDNSNRNDNYPYAVSGVEMDYDPEAMKDDGAAFTYTGVSSCYGEGDEGTTSSTIRLCATCTKEIDFGDYVTPQFANSIECDDSAPNCLNGDGTCTQKIIYYTFQALTGTDDAGKELWTPYQQYLNTSCECECLSGSLIDDYFVGNSNT